MSALVGWRVCMRQERQLNTTRHTVKPLLGALLALLALAALTSTAASAATCKKGISEAEHKTLCVEGKQVGSRENKATTTAAFTLKAGTTVVLNVSPQNWSVTCTRAKTYQTPVIKSDGTSEVTLGLGFLFSECEVTLNGKEEPKCVEPSLGTSSLSGSLASPESISLAGTEAFGQLEIPGGCSLSADYSIKGSQGCSLKQPEVEAVAKELVCEPKNSHLSFGGGFGGPPTLKVEGSFELTGTSKGEKFSITK